MAATIGMRKIRLKDVCDRITVGHVGPMMDKYTADGIPFLRSQNIAAFRLDLDDIKFVPPDFHEKLRKSALKAGDVAVVRTGYPGTACVIPNTFTELNCADLVVITPSKELNPYYLAAIFNSAWGIASVAGNLVGVAQQHFNVGAAKEMEIALPPRSTQDRIAGILSAYDELIENSQRRIKILESMARALYREWFVLFRFPDHESHPRIASPLGEIPKGWGVTALSNVCSRITDGSHYSPQSVVDGYPMASVKDMHNWGINTESCRRITRDDYDDLVRNDCKPLINDVLIAKDGSYLKHIFVVDKEQELVILSSIAMLRPNAAIRPNYLCFALRDAATISRMKGMVSGVAIPRIVLKDFRKFQILLPPESAQGDWATIVDPMLAMCRQLVAKIENLRRTRDLLLPRLLSGQIDVEAA